MDQEIFTWGNESVPVSLLSIFLDWCTKSHKGNASWSRINPQWKETSNADHNKVDQSALFLNVLYMIYSDLVRRRLFVFYNNTYVLCIGYTVQCFAIHLQFLSPEDSFCFMKQSLGKILCKKNGQKKDRYTFIPSAEYPLTYDDFVYQMFHSKKTSGLGEALVFKQSWRSTEQSLFLCCFTPKRPGQCTLAMPSCSTSFHMCCLKKILQVRWKDHIPNTEILQGTEMESMLLRSRLRLPDEHLPQSQLCSGKRFHGGQIKHYKDLPQALQYQPWLMRNPGPQLLYTAWACPLCCYCFWRPEIQRHHPKAAAAMKEQSISFPITPTPPVPPILTPVHH